MNATVLLSQHLMDHFPNDSALTLLLYDRNSDHHAIDDGPHAAHGDCSNSWGSDCGDDCVVVLHRDDDCWQQQQRHNSDSVEDTRNGTRSVVLVGLDPQTESADVDEEERDESSVHTFEVADVVEMFVLAALDGVNSNRRHLVEQKILE